MFKKFVLCEKKEKKIYVIRRFLLLEFLDIVNLLYGDYF